MKPRQFHFDEHRITLPKGTRVVLRTDLCADDGYLCKQGTVGVVSEVAYDSYTIRTPAGRHIECQRDQLSMQNQDHMAEIARRQNDWESLRETVIYSAVVGSIAWGLADETSDEDVKGVFVLPFDQFAGLWEPVDEIHDPRADVQYWEVQKLIYQGLRADAGTLELLWSPHVKVMTARGEELRNSRRMFVSQNIFGTFGRYAMSQFRKMRAACTRATVQQRIVELIRDDPRRSRETLVDRLCQTVTTGKDARQNAEDTIKDLYCSLYDRGLLAQRGYEPLVELLLKEDIAEALQERPRWKNAYNLLRLLHSGIRWLAEGEPLIEVTGPLREELLAVKRGEVPLDEVLARGDVLAEKMEQAFNQTALPKEPDYEAAHRFLLRCREDSAGHWLGRNPSAMRVTQDTIDPALPLIAAPKRFDIPEEKLRSYLERHGSLDFVVASIVGSHKYGFPSRDSDFDLKAIHLAPAHAFLGLDEPEETAQFLGDYEGLEMDFISHEARGALRRMLLGDGNVLERILSPYQVLPIETDQRLMELRQLAIANFSKRYFRHYSGFFRGMIKQYEKEGIKKIKPLLYMFRVALTGIHLLAEKQLLADLKLLLEIYPFPQVQALFALKERAELATIEDDQPYLALLPRLEAMLEKAHQTSTLPEDAPCQQEIDGWLRKWRLG